MAGMQITLPLGFSLSEYIRPENLSVNKPLSTSWAGYHLGDIPACGLKTSCPLVMHIQSSQWRQAKAPQRGPALCNNRLSCYLHPISQCWFGSLLLSF